MPPISARPGRHCASTSCPPSTPDASISVTRWPRSAATDAALSPAGPPPTTSTSLTRAARTRVAY